MNSKNLRLLNRWNEPLLLTKIVTSPFPRSGIRSQRDQEGPRDQSNLSKKSRRKEQWKQLQIVLELEYMKEYIIRIYKSHHDCTTTSNSPILRP